MEFIYPEGATPLDQDATGDLIPSLSTQKELNEFEFHNIGQAKAWALKSRKLRKILISVEGIQLLHNKMFDETWKWAGKFRQRRTNIGVEPFQILVQTKQLTDNVNYWIENQTYLLQEIAVRYHHKLVQIHPFPNGNGRLCRLSADLLLLYRKEKALSWGRTANLEQESDIRREYLAALKEADKNKYERLMRFALK